MTLSTGARLGPYQIVEQIGAGGMGEVYCAVDTRLNRKVAIKVCLQPFTERFEREGRAIAALNHPHICTLYDLGPNYLVMELVEGETLAARLRKGPLPVNQALRYAMQIADALGAAHTQGIIHRDLKPGNIMLRPDGHAKVLDFGVARILQPRAATGSDPAEAATETQTQIGGIVGTLAYMAPEQARGEEVDARADLWSLGVVLHEMLTGTRPFTGGNPPDLFAAILTRDPPPARSINRTVPRGVQLLIDSLLQKDRDRRCASAAEAFRKLQQFSSAPHRSIGKRQGVFIAAAILGALAITAAMYRSSKRAWARYQAIPQIHALADRGDYAAAYRLSLEAARFIPGDPALLQLLPEVSRTFSVRTNPPGAEVQWKPYGELRAPWQTLGRSPIEKATLPAEPIRFRLAAAGYEPIEVAATGTEYQFDFKRAAALPHGMVDVPAGPVNERIAGIGILNIASLEEFQLDRFEVTNRQFKDFMDRGGYERREYWKAPFLDHGKTVGWTEAIARFRDPTGRAGPATWEAGAYPPGQDSYPVSGVSWYEAMAYAEFAGKNLPSVYHWIRAANIRGGTLHESWFTAPLSNFNSPGTKAVGSSGAVDSLGAYDLAGNVREWCRDETGGGRYILGGSYADDSYMLARGQTASPFDRSATNGFRCMRYANASGSKQALPAIAPDPRPDYDKIRPVSDDVFASYVSLYAYAKKPLRQVVESVDESAELWRREKVRFQAPYGDEQIVAYLFSPKRGQPPYQCVLYMGAADILQPGSGERIQPLPYILESGRAMLYPIFKYTLDRFSKLGADPVSQRDAIVIWHKDLATSIDYLETRKTIDATKLAYMGGSLGSPMGPMLLAREDRVKVAILMSAGLRPHGLLPEADPVNFLPRMKIPTLMVTGRYDTILPVELAQRPMFRKLGTPAQDKRHVILAAGHGVQGPEVRNQLIREVLDWLDRYLGKP